MDILAVRNMRARDCSIQRRGWFVDGKLLAVDGAA
jgi:hypothetical protein